MKKKEGAAGGVLGGGSFLRREGVPGTRKKAPVIERRRGFSWTRGPKGEVSGRLEESILLLMLALLLGKKSTSEKRYRCLS